MNVIAKEMEQNDPVSGKVYVSSRRVKKK